MRKYFGILACLLTVWLVACNESAYDAVPETMGAAIQQDNAALTSYALRHDDMLSVRFFYNPELNQDVTVGPDGTIALQLVGEIAVTGLRPNELERIISERYAKILRKPDVTVNVQKYAPRLFYIYGEVNQPGGYPHELGMTVVNAVALAGGFTYRAAKKEVHIVRSEDKARVPQPASQQAPVFPGDVIEVSERFF